MADLGFFYGFTRDYWYFEWGLVFLSGFWDAVQKSSDGILPSD